MSLDETTLSPDNDTTTDSADTAPSPNANSPITRADLTKAQALWAEGIVEIGEVYRQNGDYRAAAEKMIDDLYAYDLGPVLFKPTLASEYPFRPLKADALSYFVGGHFEEDGGFAIRPWKSVWFGERGFIETGSTALSMGEYFFAPHEGGDPVRVEFSFGYVRDAQGKVRINLHHSSLPYTPGS